MSFYDEFKKTAAKLFSEHADKHLNRFKGLHHDLRQANMGIMLREYVSVIFLAILLTGIIAVPFSFLISFLVFNNLFVAFLSTAFFTFLSIVVVFLLALKYPATRAHERKRNIDNNLPFACLYMNTIAGTGAPPHLMFKLLADFKEYGEVSKESQAIVEDIEVMGQDIEVALQRSAETTPSESFKELLWGMTTVIVGGGDMRALLNEKARLLMNNYGRKMEEYTNDLNMYVEIYITLVIVGSIFSIVMLTIMGAISGFETLKSLQLMMVYVFLPVTSIFFIVILKLTSPLT